MLLFCRSAGMQRCSAVLPERQNGTSSIQRQNNNGMQRCCLQQLQAKKKTLCFSLNKTKHKKYRKAKKILK
jgi:hypothetical protein